MAKRRVLKSAQRRPGPSAPRRTRKQPKSSHKAEPSEVRRSARLKALSQPRKESESGLPLVGEILQDQVQRKPSAMFREPLLKGKRDQEAQYSSPSVQESLPSERTRTVDQQIVPDPLQNWILNKRWPSEYFESDSETREELLEQDMWQEEQMKPPPPPTVQYIEVNGFRYPKPIKTTPAPTRREQSDSSLTGSSGQQSRESKSAPYRDSHYTARLAAKGSYMRKSDSGITSTSLSGYKALLSLDQPVPKDSLFRDDVFEATCESVHDRNKSRIIRSISPCIVPPAEDLAIMGATKLKCLIENVNEVWTASIPVEGPQPQPDYSVGFRRSAFTEKQLKKLDPLIGSVFDTSFFVATYQMYFPFLTCEVKGGSGALDVADRQNAHSMTVAVRGVVELYRAVNREMDLNQEILAFSILHNDRTVRIYGHYAIIDENQTTFWRHPIKAFDFTSEEGKYKWTAYRFTKNVYDIWMPTHFERICSAIDQLPPSLDFQALQSLEVETEETTGLSHDINSIFSESSDAGVASPKMPG